MERKNTVHMVYLKDLLFAALYRWKAIVCTAVVLAILAGGITAISGFSSMNKNTGDDLSGQNATATYLEEKAHLTQQIKVLKKSLAGQQNYVAESALMALDAYNFYEATIYLYVDTGYQVLPEASYQNTDKTPAVLDAYSTELIQTECLDAIGTLIGTQPYYASELITITVAPETNSLRIRIIGNTAETAQAITDYLNQQIKTVQQNLSKALCEHSVSTSITPAHLRLDTKLADTQKNAVTRITTLENDLQKAKAKLEALTPPSRIYNSTGAVIKDIVIFAVIGAVLGVVIMVFVAIAAHITGEKVYSAKLLSERTGIKVLGCVASHCKKNRLDRWLQKLEGRSICPAEVQTQLLAANLRNRCANAAPLLAVCDGTESCKTLADALQKALPQLQILSHNSLLTDPAAVDALPQCKAVMFIAQCNRTRYEDVAKQIALVDDCGKELVGCILLDG